MLVTQGNSPVTTTQVSTVMLVNKIDCWEYRERGKKLKVPHYASAAAARDGNMSYVKATCLTSRQYALNNNRLPLFPTVPPNKLRKESEYNVPFSSSYSDNNKFLKLILL